MSARAESRRLSPQQASRRREGKPFEMRSPPDLGMPHLSGTYAAGPHGCARLSDVAPRQQSGELSPTEGFAMSQLSNAPYSQQPRRSGGGCAEAGFDGIGGGVFSC